MTELLPVHEPYHTARQQHEADQLGMWIFLASEGMLFGAIFLALTVYHTLYPEAMRAGTQRLDMVMEGVGTALLLTSSTAMALAVRAAAEGRRREAGWALLATMALGIAFEAIKIHSWFEEYREGLFPGHGGPPFPLPQPAARMFFHLYFVSTGLHALHLAVGILLVAGTAAGVWLRRRMVLPERAVTIELVGLYWQFVDLVWVFLYPTLYLVSR